MKRDRGGGKKERERKKVTELILSALNPGPGLSTCCGRRGTATGIQGMILAAVSGGILLRRRGTQR